MLFRSRGSGDRRQSPPWFPDPLHRPLPPHPPRRISGVWGAAFLFPSKHNSLSQRSSGHRFGAVAPLLHDSRSFNARMSVGRKFPGPWRALTTVPETSLLLNCRAEFSGLMGGGLSLPLQTQFTLAAFLCPSLRSGRTAAPRFAFLQRTNVGRKDVFGTMEDRKSVV